MKIEKDTLPNGSPCIKFEDQFEEPCKISTSKTRVPFLKMHNGSTIQFSQEDIKALLPYIQAFVETGTIENV
jgi:hypothetical protein